MANVLMVPASGAIIFDSQAAQSSIISPLSAAPRLSYDNAGGLNITSYTTAASALDRFSVDGSNGRLFSVSDALTGIIFSVNDASGLPVIEVESNLTDKITIGAYGSNALVVNDTKVGIGTATPNEKLTVVGVISSTNIVYASGGNSNLWNSAYATVNSISANGATTYTTVNANSANWSSVYSTVCATSANYILDGGNTKSNNITIGTNDNFNLNLETAGTTIVTVTSAGNVGIGTTTAAAKLQIIHDASTNPLDIRRTGFLGSQLFTINNLGDITGGAAVFTPKLGHMVTALTVTGNGTNPAAIFQTGNVGIGTTTPNERLTVVGVISSTNVIYASGGNSDLWNSAYASVNSISANGSTTYTTVNTNSANWTSAYTSTNANSARWNSVYSSYNGASGSIVDEVIASATQGRLVITTLSDPVGTDTDLTNLGTGGSPQFTNLTVTGNLSVTGDLTFLNTNVSVTSALSVVNAGTGPALYIKQSGNTPIAYFLDADGTGDIIFENNGFVGLGTASPNNRLTVVGVISSTNIIYASGGNSNIWNSTYTSVNANSANWNTTYNTVNTNSSNWTFAYNQVNSGYLNWNSTYTTVNANSANWSSVYSTVCAASANYILDGGNTKGANILIGTNDNFNLNIETGGTTKMTVTSAGFVGIGTTAPSTSLHIYSGSSEFARFQRGTPSGTGSIGIYQQDSNRLILGYNSDVGGGQATGGIASAGVIRGDAGLHLISGSLALGGITVTTSGNVGIGTITPNEKLTVVGIISSTNIVYASGGNSNLWNSTYTTVNTNSANWSSLYSTVCAASANYILDGGNTKGANISVGTTDNFNLNLETANATRMTVTSAGNVGVGNTNPLAKLTVDGNILLGTGNMGLNQGIGLNSTNGHNTIGFGSPGSWFMGINSESSNQSLNITDANASWPGTPRVTFLRGGNVGIGTTTPAEKLTVSGNISANGTLAVTATNQSDGIGVVGNNTTAGIGMRINNTGAGGSDWWLFSSGSAPTAGLGSFALWNNNTSKYALWATSAGVVTFSNGIRLPTQFSHVGIGTYGTVSETGGGLAYITGNNIKASTTDVNKVEKVTSGANPAQFIRMRYDQGISLHTGVGASDVAGTNYADDINSRLIVNLTGNVGIGTVAPGEKLTVAGNISSSNVIYASGGNSNLWNQNTSALYQATSGQFAVRNANNFFSASQSLTGDVTVRGTVYIDKGDGNPLQEVSTKNFSIAMAIALS